MAVPWMSLQPYVCVVKKTYCYINNWNTLFEKLYNFISPEKTVVFLLYSPPSLFSTDPSSKNGCRLDAQLDGWTPATLSGPSKQPIFV
jgi:hypothetical protein